MMEEDLNYASVTFKTHSVCMYEKPNDVVVIYDEVKAGKQANPGQTENENKAPVCPLLHLVAAGLGVACITLTSVMIALIIRFNRVISEQNRENSNLTAQNLQLWTQKADLERWTEELTRERDQLNWTMGVIMEYENFPVYNHCPQKVCKACLDGWVLFQSKCYLFSESDFYYSWRSWEGSRAECKAQNADLVVIESQEEQEFINNHTKKYNDELHGYWIGLSNKYERETWTWIDGSNVTVMFWEAEKGYRISCALTLAHKQPLANWKKSSCDMRNRWICETRSLIK